MLLAQMLILAITNGQRKNASVYFGVFLQSSKTARIQCKMEICGKHHGRAKKRKGKTVKENEHRTKQRSSDVFPVMEHNERKKKKKGGEVQDKPFVEEESTAMHTDSEYHAEQGNDGVEELYLASSNGQDVNAKRSGAHEKKMTEKKLQGKDGRPALGDDESQGSATTKTKFRTRKRHKR